MRLLQACLLLAIGAFSGPQSSLALEDSSADDMDLVVIAYNSKEKPEDALIYGSLNASKGDHHQAKDYQLNLIGEGMDLWRVDEQSPDNHRRGWMYRFRHNMKEVKEEYERRDGKDFIVLLGDALDVYVTKQSPKHDTMELVKNKFLTDFGDRKIVFPSQIYCCNPWELRSVARRDWDNFLASQKEKGTAPHSTIYKHINAGQIIGYASAILEMVDEMQIWYVLMKRRFDLFLCLQIGSRLTGFNLFLSRCLGIRPTTTMIAFTVS